MNAPSGPTRFGEYHHSVPAAGAAACVNTNDTESTISVHGVTSRTPSSLVSRSLFSVPVKLRTSMWVTLSEFSKLSAFAPVGT